MIRPSVPPAAWLGLAVWLGAWFAETASWGAYATRDVRPVTACVAVAAACVLLGGVLSRPVTLRLFAFGLAAGLLAGTACWGSWRAQAGSFATRPVRSAEGVVVGDATASGGELRVTVRLPSGASAALAWPRGSPVPEAGRSVSFRTRLVPLDPSKAWSRIAAARGVVAEGRAWDVAARPWSTGPLSTLMRTRAAVDAVVTTIPGEGGDLLAAVVLGDERGVTGTTLADDCRAAGLAHLLAAGALYAGVLCYGVMTLARRAGAPRWGQVAVALGSGLTYACATGLKASVVRALLAFAFASAAALAGRRHDALAGLGLGVTVIVLANPAAAVDLGFGIGVLAVTGLCLFGPLLRRWVATALPDALGPVVPAIAVALGAQLAALPITAAAFGGVSLVGPPASVVAVPVACAGLALGVAGAALTACVPSLGMAALRPAGVVFSVVASAAHVLGSMPGAMLPLAAGPGTAAALLAGAAVLWALWPRPPSCRALWLVAALLAFGITLPALVPPPGAARIVVLDVGQGDAVLVRDGPSAMLVDTGPRPQPLRAALARQHVGRLSCVVLTHPHADHIGGFAALVGEGGVGWVGASAASPAGAYGKQEALAPRVTGGASRFRRIAVGQSWSIGTTSVTVLWPPPGFSDGNTNDESVVLLLRHGAFTALLTGDAETPVQERLLADGAVPPLDVLKVAHHGSVNGTSARCLAAWRPRTALISVGANNQFGHPHAAALRALAECGAKVRRTDREGDLTVDMTAGVGSAEAACATIGRPRSAAVAHLGGPGGPTRDTEQHGRQRPDGSQARLPHIRRRGAALAARGPPSSRPAVAGGGPRLQLRGLRG